jgi:pimeloyl-ACP methyl ester carboxylesterase
VARQVPVSRPNDEQLKLPSIGFTLAGTISKPSTTAGQFPAAVLVGGSGATDRDEVLSGIPVLGQLANALAEAGFVTIRYDKRGGGQSGGRLESSTLSDYADDVRTAVKVLAERRDVDPKRILVIGHAEGGAVALLAAARERKIAGVVLLATPGVRGTDHILEQQERALGRLALSDADRQAKIDLQRQINQAVLTGKGLSQLPAQVQRQVDTLEYQSVLSHDPASVMPKVRQPILIVQGELDSQVAPVNADRLERLAMARKNAGPVQVKRLSGVNHLLVPAGTGEVEEYAVLRDRRIVQDVPDAITAWQQSLVVK